MLAGPTRRLFAAHALDDLLIGDLAPLLLVLGLTGALLAPLRRIPRIGWLGWLCQPVQAFLLWTVNLYVWHLPSLYQAALDHSYLHTIQYLTSLAAGIVMWIALLGPVRRPHWFGLGAKVLYVVGLRVAGTVLGNLLLWSGSVEYPFYLEQDALRQISPVADQNLGGAIIALEQSILLLALFAWLYTAREAGSRGPPPAVSPEDIPAGVRAGAPSNGSLEPTAPPAAVSAAGDGRQDRQLRPVRHGCLEALEEADVLAADVDVHEPPQRRPARRRSAPAAPRSARRARSSTSSTVSPSSWASLDAPGRRAQLRRDLDRDGQRYALRRPPQLSDARAGGVARAAERGLELLDAGVDFVCVGRSPGPRRASSARRP